MIALLATAAQGGWLERNMGLMKQGILLFFVVIFLGVLLRLVLSRSDRYRRAARIPLDDQTVVDPRRVKDA